MRWHRRTLRRHACLGNATVTTCSVINCVPFDSSILSVMARHLSLNEVEFSLVVAGLAAQPLGGGAF
jgi:hypothetical protein